jgi:hypothetical protein
MNHFHGNQVSGAAKAEGGHTRAVGVLNQTSGSDRLARFKAEPGNVKLWMNHDLFPATTCDAPSVDSLRHTYFF